MWAEAISVHPRRDPAEIPRRQPRAELILATCLTEIRPQSRAPGCATASLAAGIQEELRRHDHWRRRTRACNGVLSRKPPRHQQYCRARQGHGSAAATRRATQRSSARTISLQKASLSTRNPVELFRGLSEEVDLNIMYSERGHFTLAHTDAAMRTARWRAEVNKHLGVDFEVIDADEIGRLCPMLNISEDVRYPDPRRALSPARRTGAARCGRMGLRQRRRWRAASRCIRGPR